MDTRVPRQMIKVIRTERDDRLSRLTPEDPPWLAEDPLISELCLMLLVATRHQVERELLWIAARVTPDGGKLAHGEYQKRVKDEREHLKAKGWKRIIAKLQLKTVAEWNSSMETLRLLANSYKHHPSAAPDEPLLKHLKLDPAANYASLSESGAVMTGIARTLNLQQDADYCDIAEELLTRAAGFIEEVIATSKLSPVAGAMVNSVDRDTFLR